MVLLPLPPDGDRVHVPLAQVDDVDDEDDEWPSNTQPRRRGTAVIIIQVDDFNLFGVVDMIRLAHKGIAIDFREMK